MIADYVFFWKKTKRRETNGQQLALFYMNKIQYTYIGAKTFWKFDC